MRSHHVPSLDRRSRFRIVTLKNAAWTALAILVIFVTISIYREKRAPGADEHGRLYNRRLAEPAAPQDVAPGPIVEEQQPVAEQPGADPTLLDAARREQFLRTTTTAPPVPATTAAPPATASSPPTPSLREVKRSGGRVVITGGAEGVTTEVQPPRPEPLVGSAPTPPTETTATTPPP